MYEILNTKTLWLIISTGLLKQRQPSLHFTSISKRSFSRKWDQLKRQKEVAKRHWVAQKTDHTYYFTSPTNHKELPISILQFYSKTWADSQGSPDINTSEHWRQNQKIEKRNLEKTDLLRKEYYIKCNTAKLFSVIKKYTVKKQ